jgi:starch synthase
MTPLKLLFVTSELAPFSSTGGLAYVAQSFPKHLRERGVDARIIAPKFGPALSGLPLRRVAEFDVPVAGVKRRCQIELLEHDGNLIYFVGNDHYFGRERLYNYPDEAERFLFFNAAILQFAALGDFAPDIFHGNDWLSSLLPLLLRRDYAGHEHIGASKVLLSIRNLRYQGVFPKEICNLLNIEWSFLRQAGLDFYDYVNLLKIGVTYSDMVVTSSPSYALEIQADGYDPLTATLRQRYGVVHGVVEGIDVKVDNPQTDARLFANYGAADVAEGKRRNKAMLQERLGLPVRPQVPLMGWINRLTTQKGVDLLRLAVGNGLLDEDIQIVACADGEPIFETFFAELARQHPAKFFYTSYKEELAYKIYAAADMYLMPSSYEPGGISQLISMRYGAVPIVRETGGLKDTVQPFDVASGTGTGFSFDFKSTWLMMHTIRKAIALYQKPQDWSRVVQNCMQTDCSWTKPIDAYLELFERVLAAPPEARRELR